MNMIGYIDMYNRVYPVKRWLKHFYQRRTRGWDDSETWNLDYEIAKFTLPRLRRFKEINIGYPSSLSEEVWEEYIDAMLHSLTLIVEDGNDSTVLWDLDEREYEEFERGMRLFGEYFNHLWW